MICKKIILLIFSINSKVLGVERIEDIKDFNYIPISTMVKYIDQL